ncbi:MAG: bifunctional pyr operon transcriptional regulator/uracil phosphoribosyltransferase PyrR [Ilumatobacteraceae bacterium]|nr:bifunctional pyr operon transcriptional regulator/uracil phosphoribosyltransferase PyrR [Ilumatobacteraceae bacterium]
MSSAGTQSGAVVLTAQDISRAITRIAHEILERNRGINNVVLVGMQRGGVWIADAIKAAVERVEPESRVGAGSIDVSMYRDDIGLRPVVPAAATNISVDLSGRTVVLVDDVLFTGRTVRAALEALNDYGRPRAVQLAVLVDRGHRELPIRPDYVGKNIPTHFDDEVLVHESGVVVTLAPQVEGKVL